VGVGPEFGLAWFLLSQALGNQKLSLYVRDSNETLFCLYTFKLKCRNGSEAVLLNLPVNDGESIRQLFSK